MEEQSAWKKIHNSHVVRVTYRDTDQMGFVYYANYLVWFEIGRTELMRHSGRTYRQFEESGVILPVVHASCNYKKPARYDDLIRIETVISALSRVSVTFSYRIFNEENNQLLADGETRHAMIDRRGKIVPAGEKLKKWLESNS